MLLKTLLLCILIKFIECSGEPKASPPVGHSDEEPKKSKPRQLAPKRSVPVPKGRLPDDYWAYCSFPASNIINNQEVRSTAIVHCPTDVQSFAWVSQEESDPSNFALDGFLNSERYRYAVGTTVPTNSISIFGKYALLMAETKFALVDVTVYGKGGETGWRDVSKIGSNKTIGATIVKGKLVSPTRMHLLTSEHALISVDCPLGWPNSSCASTKFHNVIHFDASRDLVAVLHSQPIGLFVFKSGHSKSQVHLRGESLLKFAKDGRISVIKEHTVLLYNKSKTILVDVDKALPTAIPIGADMLHYESPHLFALDGTTFTIYNIQNKTHISHTFWGFTRVIPSEDWLSFALHSSDVLKCDNQIQYVSRRPAEEAFYTFSALIPFIPNVLIKIIQSYIKGFILGIRNDPFVDVILTIKSIQPRQKDDLDWWTPETSVTEGKYTVFIQADELYIKGGHLKSRKLITKIDPLATDITFLTQNIALFCESSKNRIFIQGVGKDMPKFGHIIPLNGKKPERAAFYRDDKDLLHLMVLTEELTTVYTIQHQGIANDTSTSSSSMTTTQSTS